MRVSSVCDDLELDTVAASPAVAVTCLPLSRSLVHGFTGFRVSV